MNWSENSSLYLNECLKVCLSCWKLNITVSLTQVTSTLISPLPVSRPSQSLRTLDVQQEQTIFHQHSIMGRLMTCWKVFILKVRSITGTAQSSRDTLRHVRSAPGGRGKCLYAIVLLRPQNEIYLAKGQDRVCSYTHTQKHTRGLTDTHALVHLWGINSHLFDWGDVSLPCRNATWSGIIKR